MLFSEVAAYFDRLEKVSSRIEMIGILSEMLDKAVPEEIGKLVYLCQGKIAPDYEGIEAGMGEKFVEEAIAMVSGRNRDLVEKEYKKKGDLGIVAEEMFSDRRQKSLFTNALETAKVYDNLLKIAKASGPGSQEVKIKLLAELLNSASPLEARFITRIPLANLRLGIGDPTIMDALAQIYSKDYLKDEKTLKKINVDKVKDDEELARKVRGVLRERIEQKYNVFPDLGKVAEIVKKKGIEGVDSIRIEHGFPIRPTLAERLPSSREIIEKIGTCAVEAKYDGLRIQVHKKGKDVIMFSRKLENMTKMFPELVKAVREEIDAEEAIFEGEALAYNEETSEYYPFQVTIQRKRKHDVAKMANEFPLRLFVFDVMYLNGESKMDLPFRERRAIVEKIAKARKIIRPTETIITDSEEVVENFFNDCVSRGLEGIIAKDLNAPYIAGTRKFSWIKLKRSYKGELNDSVDVVIIGYFKGRGQRTKFGLGALLTAVYDKKDDSFKSIAKIGTGLSEERMVELEAMLSNIRIGGKHARVVSGIEPDVWVEPKYVIEVVADEITKSPIHEAGKKEGIGLALRFPRMVSFRQDKKPEDSTSTEEIEKMYKNQKVVSESGEQ